MYILGDHANLEICRPDGSRFRLEDAIEGHPNKQLHSTKVVSLSDVIMCSFYPTGFYAAFKIPITCLNNEVISPELVFGPRYLSLKEQLENTDTIDKKKKVLDDFFSKYFLSQPSFRENGIEILQKIIMHSKGNVHVDKLFRSFGQSRRTMERHFLKEVGVGSKYFCRILRFDHSHALKRKYPDKSWNEILYTCGYFDQSHYIREFKIFTGSSPEIYLKEKNINMDLFLGKHPL